MAVREGQDRQGGGGAGEGREGGQPASGDGRGSRR